MGEKSWMNGMSSLWKAGWGALTQVTGRREEVQREQGKRTVNTLDGGLVLVHGNGGGRGGHACAADV